MTVLFVPGMRGAGARHWQRWLAGELRDAGELYSFPEFPDPDQPSRPEWLVTLRHTLDCIKNDGPLIVMAHSAGALLWLHHAATFDEGMPRAERVLLVAPPGPGWTEPRGAGFMPAPLSRDGIAAAADSTRLVIGTGDFFVREYEARSYAKELEVELDVIPEAGHFTPEDGFGAWSSAREWMRTGATPLLGY